MQNMMSTRCANRANSSDTVDRFVFYVSIWPAARDAFAPTKFSANFALPASSRKTNWKGYNQSLQIYSDSHV
jgi:hypothetical protein